MVEWPVTYEDVLAARDRIRAWMPATPLRRYQTLDDAVGHGIRIWVKHENHNITNAFKIRNALSTLTTLTEDEKRRGIVAATRGNHGQGLAYAGQLLGIPVVICVPEGNNPEKNAAIRGMGAELIEAGKDYDESLEVAEQVMMERNLRSVPSTNEKMVIAGAATITLEILEENPDLDAMVVSVGGGSQAVGAMTVSRHDRPEMKVYGVQAANAPAIHDAWHAGKPGTADSADTFADGLATRSTYEMTFGPLCEGLAGFVKVTEAEIAEALRLLLRTTHTLVEGAGAAGMAGLMHLRQKLAGKNVGIVISGGNIDQTTLRRVVNNEL